MTPTMTPTMTLKEEIKVLCYNELKVWDDREKAKRYYLTGMMCSEGSERERYTNIYLQLCSGSNECYDEVCYE